MKLLNYLFLTCAIFLSTAIFADNKDSKKEKEAYAQCSSSSVQIPSTNSLVVLENQDFLSGIKILNDEQFKIKEKGLYLIMVTGHVGTEGFIRAGDLDLWLNKNGHAVKNTKMSAEIANWKDENSINLQTVIPLDRKDVISFGISATAPGIGLTTDAKNNAPSIIVSIVKINN